MKRILVVEDDWGWQKRIRENVEELGYQVLGPAYYSGRALELFRSERPDLVTMDGTLAAGEKGLEVAAAMRAESPAVPIIMITHHGRDKFEGRGMGKATFDSGEFKRLIAELLA